MSKPQVEPEFYIQGTSIQNYWCLGIFHHLKVSIQLTWIEGNEGFLEIYEEFIAIPNFLTRISYKKIIPNFKKLKRNK